MTNLPVWLQEIRDRVNAATKGPWMLTSSILGDSLVVLANDEETGVLFPSQVVAHIPGGKRAVDTGQFIAAAVDDVPRLVELVGEMAWNLRNVTDQVQDACRSRMTPLSQCPEPSDDYCPTCPTGLRGECGAPRSLEALRKFRGEVSSND